MKQIFATAIALLFSAHTGAAQNTVSITSVPIGAEIYINGTLSGATPARITFPEGLGTTNLQLSKYGYTPYSQALALGDLPQEVSASLLQSRTVIPVTVADDRPPANDGQITLREAIEYASGRKPPDGLDRAVLTGPVGAGRGDDIVIQIEGQGPSPVLTLRAPLPALTDEGDHLSGPPTGAILAIEPGYPLRGAGISLGPGTSVSDLTFDGFDIGLSAQGWGQVSARRITARGGPVGVAAMDGAELFLSGAQAGASVAQMVAYDGGIVDGILEPLPPGDPEALIWRSGPPGEIGHSIIEAAHLFPGDDTWLYVRKPEPQPLTEIDGLDATTTSYHMYHILGFGQSDQRWPRHVYDGRDGNYFQWDFGGDGTNQHMRVFSQRPMRTNQFTLHHLQGTSHLIRYEFKLIGRDGNTLWSTEVTANPETDVIDIDPELDFFGFRIDILETDGGAPGFSEIEAMVTDSVAYAPRSFSQDRIIFPRPPSGERGLVEIRSRLHVLGEDVFASETRIPRNNAPHVLWSSDNHSVTLPEAATGADLVAAIDGAADGALEINIPGTLTLPAKFAPISRDQLILTGGGTITGPDGAVLKLEATRLVLLRDLTLQGVQLALQSAVRVTLDAVSIADFGARPGIAVNNSDLAVVRSRIAGGETGIYGEYAGLLMVSSAIENVDTGVNVRTSAPNTLIANRLQARTRAVRFRAEGGYASVAHLLYNRARPLEPLDEQETVPYFSNLSMVAGNEPARLGYGAGSFSIENRPRWQGADVFDLRVGARISHVRLIDLAARDGQCLLMSSDSRAPEPKPLDGSLALVIHDTPVDLLCLRDGQGARLTLPVIQAATRDPAIPAAAIIELSPAEEENLSGPDLALSEQITYSVRPLGNGDPFPPVTSDVQARALSALVNQLMDSKNYPLAFDRAYGAYIENPRDSSFADLAARVTNNWAVHLLDQNRHEDARALLQDLMQVEPAVSGVQGLLVTALSAQGFAALEAGQWVDARAHYLDALDLEPQNQVALNNIEVSYQEEAQALMQAAGPDAVIAWVAEETENHPDGAAIIANAAQIIVGNAAMVALDTADWAQARTLYRDLVSLEPENEIAPNNISYSYQQEASQRLASDGPRALVDWIDAEAAQYPADADAIYSAGSLIIGNAAVDALNSGRFAEGIELASAHFNWSPSEQTHENLRIGFMLFAQDELGQGRSDTVLQMYKNLVATHGASLDLGDGLTSAFRNAALTALEAGDFAAAASSADMVAQLAPGPDADDLIGYIYGIQAQNISEAQGTVAALDFLESAMGQVPNAAVLNERIQIIGNNAALEYYDSGNPAQAVALFKRTIDMVGDVGNLSQNLLVIYSNWAVQMANAGNLDEAERIATDALRRYPGDPTLTDVINYVHQNR